jgi:hypothetical protein
MEVVGGIASILQIIDITIRAFHYVKDVRGSTRNQELLKHEAAGIQHLLETLKAKIEEANKNHSLTTSNISLLGVENGPLQQAKSAMEELTAQLTPPGSKLGRISSFEWAFQKKKSCAEILIRIQRLESLIGLALQQDIL